MLGKGAMKVRTLMGVALLASLGTVSWASVKAPVAGITPAVIASELPAGLQFLSKQLAMKTDSTSVALVEFYRSRNYQPLWVNPTGLSSRGSKLLLMLTDAAKLGIEQPALEQFMVDIQLNKVSMAAAELELSWRVFSLGQLLTLGADAATTKVAETEDDAFAKQILLAEIAAFEEPALLLRSWEPKHPDYIGLKHSLAKYQQYAEKPWGVIKRQRRLIRPGFKGAVVPKIRQRLMAEGYLLEASDSEVYDSDLQNQVQEFQRRHGLVSKGVIGKGTLAALNVSAQRRLQQIQNSLARLFTLPNDLGDQYVWVNIPAYTMAVYEDNLAALAMDVIVGKPKHATPEMVDVMEFIELNPYWNVPVSITRDELIPTISSDTDWLQRNGMKVLNWHNDRAFSEGVDWETVAAEKHLPFRLRQEPGRKNPLGKVKFLFPNKHAVYMHDTPSKGLFSRNRRAFSHGCVRLAEPMKLAEYVLSKNFDGDIDPASKVRNGRNQRYQLDRPLPVYLSYSTAWVDDENRLRFSDDIYRKDRRQPHVATKAFRRQQQQLNRLQVVLRQPQDCQSCVAAVDG